MFHIPKQTKFLVTAVTIVGENHGKDIQPAISVRLKGMLSNDWLDCLDKKLRTSLYKAGKLEEAGDDGQGELEVTTVLSETPIKRFPWINDIDWGQEFTGGTLIIDRATKPIRVEDCTASGIKFVLHPNAIELTVSVHSNKPDDALRGVLSGLIKREEFVEYLAPDDGQRAIEEEEAEEKPAKAATKKAAVKVAAKKVPPATKAAADDATGIFQRMHGGKPAH